MKFHFKAIFLGLIADLVLSFVLSTILGLILGIRENDSSLYTWSLILGLLAVAAGGYVTAWKSPDSKIANATVFGFIGVLIGLAIATISTMPMWFNITSALLIIPAAILGAYIEMRKR